MTHTAFVIVDMQKAYFRSDALEARREQLTGACNELISQAVRNNIPVFHVVTKHKRDRSTWTRNMLEDGEGYLFEGTKDVEVVEGLHVADAIEIVKTRDSAFFDTNLFDELTRRNIETIVIAGVSTHTCIFQTAADAYAHNLRVVLAGGAIASHDPSRHEAALELLKQEYRQQAWANDAVIELFSGERRKQ